MEVGDNLFKSMKSFFSSGDGLTWLSSALTNFDTCVEGLSEVKGNSDEIELRLKNFPEMVSNCLALIAAAMETEELVPVTGRRMMEVSNLDDMKFPILMSRKERYLLDTSVKGIQADIVVFKDGNGIVKTITEGIQKAQENSRAGPGASSTSPRARAAHSLGQPIY
ncbi:probable pectinesterase/pectinesterase inhibitor 34 [Impatiens glandulifera]|uniref:probable pectinesterase/pectinesterase inhibitor 34 n=1 Tax=Impatiens glandulifera TaxID=253017 RepID=UPI001FB17478|nr:probable pectinesterase/pectinesterase inhibitor 34 [Impatiens glandulifera]